MAEVIGVRFKEVGKIYYFDPQNESFNIGDKVTVETSRGVECGMVAIATKTVDDDKIVHPLKTIIRAADENDLKKAAEMFPVK